MFTEITTNQAFYGSFNAEFFNSTVALYIGENITPQFEFNGNIDAAKFKRCDFSDEAWCYLPESFTSAIASQEKRTKTRVLITENAGDTDSVLGTTTDATHLLLFSFSQLVAALNTANTLAEVRAAAEPFSGLANRLIEKVDTGDIKLPYQHKELDSVLTEIEQRATMTTNVLVTPNTHEEE